MTKTQTAWIPTRDQLPPEGVEVETKIDGWVGLNAATTTVRNVQTLKRRGRLWFFPDMAMYAYYVPTHWRYLP